MDFEERMQFADELYDRMPSLFHLDDQATCVSQPGGAYCMGSFDLLPARNEELYNMLKLYSADINNYNRTQLHRGLCISARCGFDTGSAALNETFAHCVYEWVHEAYGLGAKLAKLEFCETSESPIGRPVDITDLSFAVIVGLLLLLNVIGTVYNTMNKGKAKRWLRAWSVITNFQELVAQNEVGHSQLSNLLPVSSLKVISTIMVVAVHVILYSCAIYVNKPEEYEKICQHPVTVIMKNGTIFVQTFVLSSSFLLAYKLLLDADKASFKPGVVFVLKRILLRVIRITPLYALMVWMMATWMLRFGAGPQWTSLVGREEEGCRTTWLAHLLYVVNFLDLSDTCLIHTWYLAVDLQLYALAVVITLLLLRNPRAIHILSLLFLVSNFGNFIMIYKWNLRSISFYNQLQISKSMFSGQPSIIWLYASPWGNLPASLLGLLLAFIHHRLVINKFRIENHEWVLAAYRTAPSLMMVWVSASYYMLNVTSAPALAIYSALERPVFSLLLMIVLLGSLHKTENNLVHWHGWRVLSRVQLPAFLVHWIFVVTLFAQRTATTDLCVLCEVFTGILVLVMSYLVAFPLHVLVEAPVQKFLKTLLLR